MDRRSLSVGLTTVAFLPPSGVRLAPLRRSARPSTVVSRPGSSPAAPCGVTPPGRAAAAALRRTPPSATATPSAPSSGATGGAAAEAAAAAAAAAPASTGVPTSGLLQEPGVVAPAPLATPTDAEEDEDSALHPSWYLYDQPGNPCVVCCGRGTNKCLHCYGDGYLLIGPDAVRDRQECPVCKGTTTDMCRRCLGSGVRPSTMINEAGEEVPNKTNAEVCAEAAAAGAAYLATGASPETEAAAQAAAAAAVAKAEEGE